MIQVVCAVLDYSKAVGIDKFVLICLANYCNEKRESYPSVRTLSKDTGLADSTVQIAIKRLIELGEIEKVSEGGMVNGKHWANTYRVRDLHPEGSGIQTPGVRQQDPGGPAKLPLRGPAAGDQPLISSTSHITKERRDRPKDQEEVISYCDVLKLPKSDAQYLFSHWQSNGFTIGGKPIKDWQAVIRSWKYGGFLPSQRKPSQDQQSRKIGFDPHTWKPGACL